MRFATKDNLVDFVRGANSAYAPPVDTDLSLTSKNAVENRAITKGIRGLTSRLGSVQRIADWSELGDEIAAGNGEYVLPIGSQVTTKWTATNSNTVYDMCWNACHHAEVEVDGGSTEHVAYVQTDRCLPFDTQFSPYQAFLTAVSVIPAGTYNVTMGLSWGTHVASGKTYQFTLTKDLPSGGQLTGFYGAPNNAPSGWKVYAYQSQTSTSVYETCDVSEGDGGTSLGTFTAAGVQVPASGTPASTTVIGDMEFYGLNSFHRVAYGNNRWLHSPLRQYLNSSGTNWWVPQTVFDRPPAYASHRGFLTGLPAEFVAQMRPVKVVTALNYVSDGGTSASPQYDVTYDRVFLPSGKEHFLATTSYYGGTQGQEGVAWDYWRRVAGSSAPLAWSTSGNYSTYHMEYVQYDLAAPATARLVFLRSALRGGADSVAYVYAAGLCNFSHACLGLRAAPACAIGQSV